MSYNLIADIGGTNARFALCENGSVIPQFKQTLSCVDYPHIGVAISSYLDGVETESEAYTRPVRGVIAIACPVYSDQVSMTNHGWSFSVKDLQQQIGFEQLDVINDFAAQAMALPWIPEENLAKIGAGDIEKNYPKVLVGPGTGLGVAGLVPNGNNWIPVVGEGGHGAFAPESEVERKVLEIFSAKFPRVSRERLLSGQGLEDLYEIMTLLTTGRNSEAQDHIIRKEAAWITNQALQHQDDVASNTVDLFCKVLGSVVGDIALTFGARGGAYICGGIPPRIMPILQQSTFRSRFEDKGRMSDFVKRIPTYIVNHPCPGLLGAAAAALHQRDERRL